MDDQTLETLSHNCNYIVTDHSDDPSSNCEADSCGAPSILYNSALVPKIDVNTNTNFLDSTSDQTLETVTHVTEQLGGYIASMAERDVLDGNQEMCNNEERIEDLGNKVQDTILEQIGENTASIDKNDVSDRNQEMCFDDEQTLPILEKVEELGNKVQSLKKEHAVLCNEVKGITADSFPGSGSGSEIFSALQNLSTEHEKLKNKYHEESELLKKKYLEECSLNGSGSIMK